jgi:hypothetical protein
VHVVIPEACHDAAAMQINAFGLAGHTHRAVASDRSNPSVMDQNGAVRDWSRAPGGIDAGMRQRQVGRVGDAGHGEAERGHGHCAAVNAVSDGLGQHR